MTQHPNFVTFHNGKSKIQIHNQSQDYQRHRKSHNLQRVLHPRELKGSELRGERSERDLESKNLPDFLEAQDQDIDPDFYFNLHQDFVKFFQQSQVRAQEREQALYQNQALFQVQFKKGCLLKI